VPPKFNFFLFNEQKKGLAHHSKKWNYGGSPKIEGFYFEV
jgi:hypothetical protein